jgi:hypothetical protein
VSDPHNTRAIPLGTPVCAYDGTQLGTVREVQPHYLRVGVEGEHNDLEVPVHSILGFEDGVLRVSVKRSSVTEVDNVETAHRMGEE